MSPLRNGTDGPRSNLHGWWLIRWTVWFGEGARHGIPRMARMPTLRMDVPRCFNAPRGAVWNRQMQAMPARFPIPPRHYDPLHDLEITERGG